jgi:soluble lytic murein transglycosylase-like protein
LLDRLDEEFGGAWPPVRRARQLYAAGYIEEARREVRVAVEAFVTGGKSAGGVRHEAFEVGSGWRPTWKATQVAPTKAGRRTLRDRFAAEKLRVGLRQLSKALDEPYRMARLTDASEAGFKERWHPRAYRAVLEREARVRDIDPVHLWSLMYTESRFRRFVVSPVGARGALQIMPWTGRQLVERLGELEGGRFDSDRLFDIDYNAHLAAYYIAELLAKFHHQAPLAYASYNGGPSNVARWLEDKAKGGAPLDLDTFIEEIPFSETQRYVRRVMEVSAAYELMYRGKLPQWSNKLDPKFEDNIDF